MHLRQCVRIRGPDLTVDFCLCMKAGGTQLSEFVIHVDRWIGRTWWFSKGEKWERSLSLVFHVTAEKSFSRRPKAPCELFFEILFYMYIFYFFVRPHRPCNRNRIPQNDHGISILWDTWMILIFPIEETTKSLNDGAQNT